MPPTVICAASHCAQVVVIGGGYIGLETTAGMVVNDMKVGGLTPQAAFPGCAG